MPFHAHSSTKTFCQISERYWIPVLFRFQFYVFFIWFHGYSTYFFSYFFLSLPISMLLGWWLESVLVHSFNHFVCSFTSYVFARSSSSHSQNHSKKQESSNEMYCFASLNLQKAINIQNIFFHRLAKPRIFFMWFWKRPIYWM